MVETIPLLSVQMSSHFYIIEEELKRREGNYSTKRELNAKVN